MLAASFLSLKQTGLGVGADYYILQTRQGQQFAQRRYTELCRQIEAVFSDERLKALKLLRKHMDGNPMAWLHVDHVADVHRVRRICSDKFEILFAIEHYSGVLQVSEDGLQIRRKPHCVTFPQVTVDRVREVLASSKEAHTSRVHLVQRKDAVVAHFSTLQDAKAAMTLAAEAIDWRESVTLCCFLSDEHAVPQNRSGRRILLNLQRNKQGLLKPPSVPKDESSTETAHKSGGPREEGKKSSAKATSKKDPPLTKTSQPPMTTQTGTISTVAEEVDGNGKRVLYGFVRTKKRTPPHAFRVPWRGDLRYGDKVSFQSNSSNGSLSALITSLSKLDTQAAKEQAPDTRPSSLRLRSSIKSIRSPAPEAPKTSVDHQPQSSFSGSKSARGPDRSGDIGFTQLLWRNTRQGRSGAPTG